LKLQGCRNLIWGKPTARKWVKTLASLSLYQVLRLFFLPGFFTCGGLNTSIGISASNHPEVSAATHLFQ
jgi:hypothetical protein